MQLILIFFTTLVTFFIGSFSEERAQNKKASEACEKNQVLVIDGKVFQCVHIDIELKKGN